MSILRSLITTDHILFIFFVFIFQLQSHLFFRSVLFLIIFYSLITVESKKIV